MIKKFSRLLCLVCFIFFPQILWAAAPSVGSAAPEFNLKSLDGRKVQLSDYRGKFVLINFWATWCGPCKIEMPSLEFLHQKFKSQNLEIIAISNDMFGATVVEPYIKAHKLTFTVLLDPKLEASDAYGVLGLPTTFLIDPKGIVIGVLNGAEDWSKKETFQYFENLLKPSP